MMDRVQKHNFKKSVSKLCEINYMDVSSHQYESKRSINIAQKYFCKKLQRMKFQGYNIPASLKCKKCAPWAWKQVSA
jgi:hypothetical protein